MDCTKISDQIVTDEEDERERRKRYTFVVSLMYYLRLNSLGLHQGTPVCGYNRTCSALGMVNVWG